MKKKSNKINIKKQMGNSLIRNRKNLKNNIEMVKNKYISNNFKGNFGKYIFNSNMFENDKIYCHKNFIFNDIKCENNKKKIIINDKTIYECNFKYGNGILVFYDPIYNNNLKNIFDNNIYEGNYKYGKIIINNGDSYKVIFKSGKLSSFEKNINNFENSKRDGFGKFITNDYIYEGNFKDGKMNGFGKIIFENHTYDSIFENNKIILNYIGKITLNYGNIYECNFINGKLNIYN